MTAPALDAPLYDLPALVAPQSWSGLLLPTNTPAGDGRVMVHDDTEVVPARPLPLPLLAQPVLAQGHEGAIRVGMIRRLWMGEGGVWGEGTFNPDPDGQEWAARVARGEGWVSIDLSDVVVEKVPVDSEGRELEPEELEAAADLSAQVQERLSRWKVMGATLVSHPAFEDSYVESWALAASAGEARARVRYALPSWSVEAAPQAQATPTWTSLTAAGLAFDAADFADPHLDGPTALTIDEDGRVYGHLATWGTCHIAYSGVCVTAPPSRSGYAYFAHGLVNTRDGGQVPVGKITMGTGHASTADGTRWSDAASHYDNTGSCVALVAAGEDPYGIWLAGHMLPGTSQAQIDTLRHSGVSGDWREIAGDMELVAALAVNVPGFPVPRTIAASGVLLAAGVVTPGAAARAREAAELDEVAAMRRRVSAAALQPMRERMGRAAVESMRAVIAAAAGTNSGMAGESDDEQQKGQRIVRTQEGAERYGVDVGQPIPPGGKGAQQPAQATKPATSMDSEVNSVWEKIKRENPAEEKSSSKSSSGGGSSSKSTKEKDTTTKGEVPSGSKKLGSSVSARKSGDSAYMEEDESPDTGAKGGKLTKFESGVAYYDDGTMSDGKSWYTAGESKSTSTKTSSKTTSDGTKATSSTKSTDSSKSTSTKTTEKTSSTSSDPITNLVQSILALFTGKSSSAPSSSSSTAPSGGDAQPTPEQRVKRVQQTRDMMAELGRMLDEEERQARGRDAGGRS